MTEFMKRSPVNIFMFDLNGGQNNNTAGIELSAAAADSRFFINFSHINSANINNIKNNLNNN
jgi:hypothetical protein